jgi:hypothetical protein
MIGDAIQIGMVRGFFRIDTHPADGILRLVRGAASGGAMATMAVMIVHRLAPLSAGDKV